MHVVAVLCVVAVFRFHPFAAGPREECEPSAHGCRRQVKVHLHRMLVYIYIYAIPYEHTYVLLIYLFVEKERETVHACL
ncbi:hypothetical protein TRSC58_07581 [Trypanosoma rangeli SC58]|uniref:Secreted protein n=1 Tax=Trypanosoma rangeli SC58 TaxID=429131 RepID=A0A061ISW2_TRYRA|nr:hypothetical protein TRSC58_07581 [Trypanosoma rangeli SC58]